MNIQSLYPPLNATSTANLSPPTVAKSGGLPCGISLAGVAKSGGLPCGISLTELTATGRASSASISKPAQLFSEMQQLSQQNPAEFKAVAAQLAASFQNAAGQVGGSQAKLLSSVASDFTQAAQTGQLQGPQSASRAQRAAASGQTGSHHHQGGWSEGQSSEVQQAFQNAMSILDQALQGTSASSSSTGQP